MPPRRSPRRREGAIARLDVRSKDTTTARLEAAWAERRAGNTKRAATLCQRVVKQRPKNSDALHLLGLLSCDDGRTERGIQLLEKAAAGGRDRFDIQCDLGNALKRAGRFDEAIATHRRVAEALADSPEAQSNLGSTLRAAGRIDEAVLVQREAVALRPDDAELRFNLGNALLLDGRFNEAAEALSRAVELFPGHSRAWANRGVAFKETGALDKAIESFEHAVTNDGRNADARWNLSIANLMAGSWRTGWRGYEARREIAGFPITHRSAPGWDGRPSPAGPVIIAAEQGLGDTIQFARYLYAAKARAGEVVFACQSGLLALLGDALPGIPVVAADRALPPHADVAPLLSLPHLLDMPEPYWPETGPYLRADPERERRWHAWLPTAGVRIGVAWQGSTSYRGDRRRSMGLHHFAPLAELDGVELISLQIGPGAEQRGQVPWADRLIDPGRTLDGDGAFLDSAAIMTGLDLVVTSDTSIAHLAGALGVRTWMALAHVPDWRWGMTGKTTPWYPSMRLFRQTEPGNWNSVFADIAAALIATGPA